MDHKFSMLLEIDHSDIDFLDTQVHLYLWEKNQKIPDVINFSDPGTFPQV